MNSDFVDKIFWSILIIIFYSFLDAVYENEKFFKEKESILKNDIIQKKMKELYPEYAKNPKHYKKILNELEIDLQINFA